ncbi:MAG: hypothetical protein K2K70_05910 [Lachnospiraceae bacterium]|nr:hypothetical protein [Lachnospiraceae bacterium]
MVKRPIHMHLPLNTLDQQKLLDHFKQMQIIFVESVLAENDLSEEEQGRLIYAAREKLEEQRVERLKKVHTA